MNEKEIQNTRKELREIIAGIEQTITELDKINPNEPIGANRNKMIQDYYFACDLAKYGNMILNNDLWAIYEELKEDCGGYD